nr:MAG TPA: hypothetical protein [Caudoviricetes sp.]
MYLYKILNWYCFLYYIRLFYSISLLLNDY